MPTYSCKTIKNELFDVEGDGGESSVRRAARQPRSAQRSRATGSATGVPRARALARCCSPPSRARSLPAPPFSARSQVAAFKARVAQNRACDVSAIKLICGGKVLKDEDSLDKAGVKDKAAGGFIVVMISAAKVRRTHACARSHARARAARRR